MQNLEQKPFGSRQHAEVIEWTTAAQRLCWNLNLKSTCFQNANRRLGSLRKKIIVQRVCPENYFGIPCILLCPFFKPAAKGLTGKPGKLALRSHARGELGQTGKNRQSCSQICDSGCMGCNSRPNINVAESIGAARA